MPECNLRCALVGGENQCGNRQNRYENEYEKTQFQPLNYFVSVAMKSIAKSNNFLSAGADYPSLFQFILNFN